MEDGCKRRGIARQRLLAESRRKFVGAELEIKHKNVLSLSWLSASGPVIANPHDPGEKQSSILCNYLAAWPDQFRNIVVRAAWTLDETDHASARFLQRSAGGDLKAALFEAARHFHAADVHVVAAHVGRETDVFLRAGDGMFLGNVIGACSPHGYRFLYVRCETWVSDQMLRPNQLLLPEAVSADQSVAALLLP